MNVPPPTPEQYIQNLENENEAAFITRIINAYQTLLNNKFNPQQQQQQAPAAMFLGNNQSNLAAYNNMDALRRSPLFRFLVPQFNIANPNIPTILKRYIISTITFCTLMQTQIRTYYEKKDAISDNNNGYPIFPANQLNSIQIGLDQSYTKTINKLIGICKTGIKANDDKYRKLQREILRYNDHSSILAQVLYDMLTVWTVAGVTHPEQLGCMSSKEFKYLVKDYHVKDFKAYLSKIRIVRKDRNNNIISNPIDSESLSQILLLNKNQIIHILEMIMGIGGKYPGANPALATYYQQNQANFGGFRGFQCNR
jgi:hypothetical protein